ncbi:GTP-binding protein [Litchfieldella xinjiangensis]|uniref:GTP-binding protein n=1 Tax=Litchfieldella xinjiangensis TaxID=1166948 RepID=UPI0012DFFD79
MNLTELGALLDHMPKQILRFKGVLLLSDEKRLALQRAAGSLTSWELERKENEEESRLFFIGEDTPSHWVDIVQRLDRLRAPS